MQSNIRTRIQALKSVVREPYAWPGGYERFLIMDDGAAICHKCAKNEFKLMLHSTMFNYKDGWDVAGHDAECNSDGPIDCANCYASIIED